MVSGGVSTNPKPPLRAPAEARVAQRFFVFPSEVSPVVQQDNDNGDLDVGETECGDKAHLFHRALTSTGLLHLTDNLVCEINKSFKSWPWFVAGLRQVTHLLGKRNNRSRFLAACLAETEFAVLQDAPLGIWLLPFLLRKFLLRPV